MNPPRWSLGARKPIAASGTWANLDLYDWEDPEAGKKDGAAAPTSGARPARAAPAGRVGVAALVGV